MVTITFITDGCCYYYSIVPRNVTTVSCNPQGMSIIWLCQIYTHHDDYTNLSVQWYKAAPGTVTVDMAEGELLSEQIGKYSFTVSRRSSIIANQSALFLDNFSLTIHNFNSSTDDGYYWCQIVANGSCPLEPSPIGYMALDQFPVEKCAYSLLDFIDPVMPPICAEGTLCQAEEQTTLANDDKEVNNHATVIASTSMIVILYGIIGGLVFIIICLLLIIVACTGCNVRNHRTSEAIRGKQRQLLYYMNAIIATFFHIIFLQQKLRKSTTQANHSIIMLMTISLQDLTAVHQYWVQQKQRVNACLNLKVSKEIIVQHINR